MRIAAAICFAFALVGCAGGIAKDGTPIVHDGSLVGIATEAADPGSTYKARQAYDDARCQDFGFKPGTDAYSNCRLRLEETRQAGFRADAAAAAARPQAQTVSQPTMTTIMDANTGRMIMCSGPSNMRTCF